MEAPAATVLVPVLPPVLGAGLTIDFDCKVGSSRCTNRWGTRDDSWSGDLGEGPHSVEVYPWDPGPGDYSLTVTATETVTFVETPLGGAIRLRVCEDNGDGGVVPGSCVEVVIPLGEGNPEDGDGGGGGGGGTTPTPEQQEEELEAAITDALARLEECSVYNDLGDGRSREYDPSSYISAASILDEIPHEGASCSDPREPFAHVDAIPGREIHICPSFYSLSLPRQSRTIIHEGLHLMGVRHEDFLLPGGVGDETGRQMNEAISASCYTE